MTYCKEVENKCAEPIYNVNTINNHVYYDDYKGYRAVTGVSNIVIKNLISKLDIIYLF